MGRYTHTDILLETYFLYRCGKIVPVPKHRTTEADRGSGRKSPRIVNLGNRTESLASRSGPLYLRVKSA